LKTGVGVEKVTVISRGNGRKSVVKEGRISLPCLDKLNKNHLTRNLVHRLERLGYSVTLEPQQKAA
jgi:hypothetical protein